MHQKSKKPVPFGGQRASKEFVPLGGLDNSQSTPDTNENQDALFYAVDINLIVHRIVKPSKRLRMLAFRSFAP